MSSENYSPMYGPVTDIRKIRADRIREQMAVKGMDQGDLARHVGVTQGTISLILTGKTKDSRHYPAIADALGVNLSWIMGNTDNKIDVLELMGRVAKQDIVARASEAGNADLANSDMSDLTGEEPPPRSDNGLRPISDTVELHEFDISFGLGAAFIHDVPVTGAKRGFSRAFIRNFTKSPFEYLFFAKGSGTSMMPTILDNDIVLIDTFQKTPKMSDQFWALEMGGMGMIKRLRPTKDGLGVRICSDGGLPDDVAYDGEMQVIGRVVGIFRKT